MSNTVIFNRVSGPHDDWGKSYSAARKQLLIKPLLPDFKAPVYSSLGAAAFDIRTPIDFALTSLGPLTINLGFAAKVPDGHVAIIAPRSGLGSNHGVGLRNTIGEIDSDYTGEWRVTLTMDMFNQREPIKEFKAGDRIVQCTILPVEQVDFIITDKLPETERGEGGYGSTGLE